MGRINGVLVCRKAPQISHLFFIENSIIFYKAILEEANRVSQILKDYELSFSVKTLEVRCRNV